MNIETAWSQEGDEMGPCIYNYAQEFVIACTIFCANSCVVRRRSLPAGDGWLGTRIDIRLNHGIDAMALGYPSVTRNLRSSGSGTLLGHATVISRRKEVPLRHGKRNELY
jgi:hypothetical protein